MTGHLYLHVGPPKTATTALQIALQTLKIQNYCYLGVRQPRDPLWREPSGVLHEYCSGNLPRTAPEVENALATMHEGIANGYTLFLCEEMFLVWEEQADFWTKLQRLEELVHDMPHTYAITLRNPAEALVSYYQELYAKLTVREQIDATAFFKHERCQCYDYLGLLSWFRRRGLRVNTLDFRTLAMGWLKLRDLIGKSGQDHLEFEVPRANVGARGTGGNWRILPAVPMSAVFRRGLPGRIKYAFRKAFPRLFEVVKPFGTRVFLRRAGEHVVTIPANVLTAFHESYEGAMAELTPYCEGERVSE